MTEAPVYTIPKQNTNQKNVLVTMSHSGSKMPTEGDKSAAHEKHWVDYIHVYLINST